MSVERDVKVTNFWGDRLKVSLLPFVVQIVIIIAYLILKELFQGAPDLSISN